MRPSSSTEMILPSGFARRAAGTARLSSWIRSGASRRRAAIDAAAPRARIVQLGQSAGPEATLTSGSIRLKSLSILGYTTFLLSLPELRQAYLEVAEHVAAGKISIDVETFALDEIGAAWSAQAAGRKAVVLLS